MRYIIGVLALAFSVSAFAAPLYKEKGYIEKLRYADVTIAENSSQRRSYVILVERPRFAECGEELAITPEALSGVGNLLSAGWVKGTQVGVSLLDFSPGEKGGCQVVNANVTD